uniref:RabBD domain-containing protein n=1 Tax=Dendroctonus ponderosae TaxID=77166 RepID=A0AAR5QG29_DENPD
ANPPLGEEEQQTIVEVIQRAEKLDLTEQERVGKLVDRLENMRRSALGRGANQCLLCGDTFGMLGPQKVRCVDCKRWACQQCAIDQCAHKSPGASKDHQLCMICAETREIWKKSGAWFFKGLPKYILPDESRFKRSRSVRASRRRREQDSSSDEERQVYSWGRMRRNSCTESTHDAPEQLDHSTGTNNVHINDLQLAKELEPLRNYMGSMNLAAEPRSCEDFSSDRGEAESAETSRPQSMASRSISDWNWTDTKSMDGQLSPSTASLKSAAESDRKPPMDTSMGIIELSLNYDQAMGILHCTVYRAKNLIPMDIAG